MNTSFIEYLVPAVLLIVAFALVAWFLSAKRSRSEWRMTTMLLKAGVNIEAIDNIDHIQLIKDIRSRCRRCQAEDVCERWLAGKYEGAASFCPNEQVIRALVKRVGESAGKPEVRTAA